MIFALSFVALAVLATTVVAQEPNCARNYTVKPGDFCDSISAAQNVSTFQLANVNADKIDAACDNLAVGEPLCLGILGQDCNITTVVQSGDSCAAIATNTNIRLGLLLLNNPNVDANCDNLHVGEVLCTANQLFVQE